MKYYISFCYSQTIAGGQNYLNSKIGWLKENGWQPIVFTASRDYRIFKIKKKIPWDNLGRFSKLVSVYLSMPPEFWPKIIVKRVLNRMISVIDKNAEQIIIESHTDYWAEWGEILARKLSAKNFCFLIDELLEQYEAKEFLYFKFLRGEVAGIHKTSIHRLFAGYAYIPIDEKYVLKAANYGSVADIDSEVISNIKKSDYNIAYIGREKQYVENIVKGVIKFAKHYSNHTIKFISLGGLTKAFINEYNPPSNLIIIELGFINPIPRVFFEKVDVVIAGSGCASLSVREKVPVIVADAGTQLSSGVLGYTIKSTLFSEANFKPFDEALSDVLIEQSYKKYEFLMPPTTNPDTAYKEHFCFIQNSDTSKTYFDFDNKPQRDSNQYKGFIVILRANLYILKHNFYVLIKKFNNVI